ncbi:MAG: hypothetical protein HY805_02470 [Nitrospirae bacterium]|nr:hypothetical protein [Nitrospirota bacterium]
MIRKGVFLALSILLFTSCSSEKFSGGEYKNRDMGFLVQFPDSWIQGEKSSRLLGTVVTIFNFHNRSLPADATVSITVVNQIPDLQSEVDFEDYYRSVILIEETGLTSETKPEEVLEKVLPYMEARKEISSGRTTLDTTSAWWFSINHERNRSQYKSTVYYAINNGRWYAVRCEASEDNYHAFKDTFEEIIKSFKFLGN